MPDPRVDWKDASTTWSAGRGTCEGIANVIIAALRSLDIPAGLVAAGVVDGTENVAFNCVVMNLPTYGHAFLQDTHKSGPRTLQAGGHRCNLTATLRQPAVTT